MAKYTFEISLNGTDVNPYNRLGLTQNPFPQLAKHEWAAAERQLNKLGGDPIPDTAYIRTVLTGFDPEFVELCCRMFKKGEMVKFTVTFSE